MNKRPREIFTEGKCMFSSCHLNWSAPHPPFPSPTSHPSHLRMVCYMSRWVLNKEQREGSGGLLVAQDGFLPTPSKEGSFFLLLLSEKACGCIPWKVHRKYITALSSVGQERLFSRCTVTHKFWTLIQFNFLQFSITQPRLLMLLEGVLKQPSLFSCWEATVALRC